MLPVHHLPPMCPAHGPDLSAKKSRSTFNWPISWYDRVPRAASFLAFWSWPLLKTPAIPSRQSLLPSSNLTQMDFISGRQLSYRLVPLHASIATLALKAALCFLRPFNMSFSFLAAIAVLSLGAELSLSYLSS